MEARWSRKRDVEWVGYKVHVSETCDADAPRLITHVETTPATIPDSGMSDTIHHALARKDLLPREHIVDAGYVDAGEVLTSRQVHDVDLVGPVHADPSWQARDARGFESAHFVVDWDTQTVRCPQGKVSTKWQRGKDAEGVEVTRVRFAKAACLACPCRARCTRAEKEPRELTLRPQREQVLLQAARARQKTAEFQVQYAARAGIEGTLSQGVRRCDMRRSRYIGLRKTHLQHVITAASLNIIRITAWLDERPLAPTRRPHFVALTA